MISQNDLAKKIVLLLFTVHMFGIIGCSVLVRRSDLQPELSNTGWVQLEKYVGQPHKWMSENVSVVVSPYQDCLDGFLWIGPPILPTIPWPSNCGDFCIQVQIESPKDISMLDLSNIRVELSGGKSYQASGVYLSKKVKESLPLACHSPYIFKSDQVQIETEKFVISQEKKHLCISFNISYKGMEEFTIDLGSISINDNNIPLPALNLRKKWTSGYSPLENPGHGHGPFWIRLSP